MGCNSGWLTPAPLLPPPLAPAPAPAPSQPGEQHRRGQGREGDAGTGNRGQAPDRAAGGGGGPSGWLGSLAPAARAGEGQPAAPPLRLPFTALTRSRAPPRWPRPPQTPIPRPQQCSEAEGDDAIAFAVQRMKDTYRASLEKRAPRERGAAAEQCAAWVDAELAKLDFKVGGCGRLGVGVGVSTGAAVGGAWWPCSPVDSRRRRRHRTACPQRLQPLAHPALHPPHPPPPGPQISVEHIEKMLRFIEGRIQAARNDAGGSLMELEAQEARVRPARGRRGGGLAVGAAAQPAPPSPKRQPPPHSRGPAAPGPLAPPPPAGLPGDGRPAAGVQRARRVQPHERRAQAAQGGL
jgi:hypothetical protein